MSFLSIHKSSACVLPLDLDHEFYTDENCYITELSNGEHDPDLSIARARVEPGITTVWHSLHGITERYVILQGFARVEVGEHLIEIIKTGDCVIIPPDTRQRITNIGTEALIFHAICTPRYQSSRYQALV